MVGLEVRDLDALVRREFGKAAGEGELGVEIRPIHQIDGGSHFNEVFFSDLRIPKDWLVGDLNNGWNLATAMVINGEARQACTALLEELPSVIQLEPLSKFPVIRDLLVDREGRGIVADFGLARETGTGSMTESGAIVGTPMYISPEQARNPQDVDVRGDLYSLGATLSTEYVDFDLRFWGNDGDTFGDVGDERVVLTVSRAL